MWFFFFKQKTAYEMRISDWSSDVCSSDLLATHPGGSPAARFSAPALHYCDVGIIQKINLFVAYHLKTAFQCGHQPMEDRSPRRLVHIQIGRASCRERVCQYV